MELEKEMHKIRQGHSQHVAELNNEIERLRRMMIEKNLVQKGMSEAILEFTELQKVRKQSPEVIQRNQRAADELIKKVQFVLPETNQKLREDLVNRALSQPKATVQPQFMGDITKK